MLLNLLKCKIHRATVTDADLSYKGSISICPKLRTAAGLLLNERVDVVNINTGARFSTYVIAGKDGEICLNGAAARLVQKTDLVIIMAYGWYSPEEAEQHEPTLVYVDGENRQVTA